MTSEQLLKLAEIAGKCDAEIQTDEISGDRFVAFLDEFDCWTIWRPHEDIAQAFEVLELCDFFYEVKNHLRGEVYMYEIVLDENRLYSDCTLPEAICKAVLESIGCKK